MTTPTKPKRPVDVGVEPLHLTEAEGTDLCLCAGHSPKSKIGRAFLAHVVRRLSWHREMLRRAPDRSSPSHTRVSLTFIATHAAALIPWIDPAKMPKEVAAEMRDTDIADTFMRVMNAKLAADEGLARLSDQGGPGQLKRLQSETRDQAMHELAHLHRNLSLECEEDDGDLREFLARCAKYLEV